MPRTLGSQRHEALRKFIKEKRKKADLTRTSLRSSGLCCYAAYLLRNRSTGRPDIDNMIRGYVFDAGNLSQLCYP
jgi:hypothetical protein